MKKCVMCLIVALFLSGCAASTAPRNFLGISADTPVLGGFVDTTPTVLQDIHKDVLYELIEEKGAEPWVVNPMKESFFGLFDHRPAAIDKLDTNYVVECRQRLLAAGYKEYQLEYGYCSMFDYDKWDHVVLIVTELSGKRWIFDSRFDWLMTPLEINSISLGYMRERVTDLLTSLSLICSGGTNLMGKRVGGRKQNSNHSKIKGWLLATLSLWFMLCIKRGTLNAKM